MSKTREGGQMGDVRLLLLLQEEPAASAASNKFTFTALRVPMCLNSGF